MVATFSGGRARALRQMAGLSRFQLGVRVSKAQASIHRFESGAGQPSLTTLCDLAAVLNCSVGDFFHGDRPSVGTAMFEVSG